MLMHGFTPFIYTSNTHHVDIHFSYLCRPRFSALDVTSVIETRPHRPIAASQFLHISKPQHQPSTFAWLPRLRGSLALCLRAAQRLQKSIIPHRQKQGQRPRLRPLSRDRWNRLQQLCRHRVGIRPPTIFHYCWMIGASRMRFWIGSRVLRVQGLCLGGNHGSIHHSK